ncbi:MAG: hypothetical protein GWP12_03845 [Nitrospirae bacterium]|nr:hypothetical protein [Nitrospirota bacterium]
MGKLFEKVEGTAPPQTPSDRDSGWLGRKTYREKKPLTIRENKGMGSSKHNI